MKLWAAIRKSNENFFYAFLRNRLPAEASDFPLFMGKSFGARIPLGNKRVRFYHFYSEFLSASARIPPSPPFLWNQWDRAFLNSNP